jgi:hypothetical protein
VYYTHREQTCSARVLHSLHDMGKPSVEAKILVLNEQQIIFYKCCENILNSLCSNAMPEFILAQALSMSVLQARLIFALFLYG